MTNLKDKQAAPSTTPVSFPRWREVLHNEPLASALVQGHEREIFAFLKYLKAIRRQASVASVLEYLRSLEEQGKPTEATRAALRWFFLAAADQAQSGVDQIAPPAEPAPVIRVEQGDQGGPPWEQQMVTVLRTRHLKWRTEEAYRAISGDSISINPLVDGLILIKAEPGRCGRLVNGDEGGRVRSAGCRDR